MEGRWQLPKSDGHHSQLGLQWNGRYGFNNTGTTATAAAYGTVENYNAYYNNATAAVNGVAQGAGFPGVPASVGTGYLDIGALHHQTVAGAKAVGFVGP